MLASRQHWFLQRSIHPFQIIIPAVAGCLMVCASILPWLHDSLGENYSAWRLPIDIGWQFRVGVVNYGVLCLCCAVFAFLVAYANWKPFTSSDYFAHKYIAAGCLCILPVALFLFQYLCVDLQGIAQLGQHKIQALLYQQHFGYATPQERISIKPFALNTSTVLGRLVLLADQITFVPLLPCLCSWMLIDYRRFIKIVPRRAEPRTYRRHTWLFSVGICMLVVAFGRAPASMVCEYEARAALAAGNYANALSLLDGALILNPALDQVAYYHIDRGQALYLLHPDQQNSESRTYLAFAYREQGDYLDSYQELLAVWQTNRTVPWVMDEMTLTLERLAEFTKPLNGPPIQRPENDDTALPWVQLLTQIDPNNVYGRYVKGRIEYDLHNYTACIAEMSASIQVSQDTNFQSSAYTYIALSDAGNGDYSDERILLIRAIGLDPYYYNNTAREELSGLR